MKRTTRDSVHEYVPGYSLDDFLATGTYPETRGDSAEKQGVGYGLLQEPKFAVRIYLAVFRELLLVSKTLRQHRAVHNDIKPKNLIIRPKDPNYPPVLALLAGNAELVLVDEDSVAGVGESAIVYTKGYVAPERLVGDKASKPADEYSDLYSIGQTLTDVYSYIGTEDGEVWRQQLSEEDLVFFDRVAELMDAFVIEDPDGRRKEIERLEFDFLNPEKWFECIECDITQSLGNSPCQTSILLQAS